MLLASTLHGLAEVADAPAACRSGLIGHLQPIQLSTLQQHTALQVSSMSQILTSHQKNKPLFLRSKAKLQTADFSKIETSNR